MASDRSSPSLEHFRWWRRKSFKITAASILFIFAFLVVERLVGEWMWRSYQNEARARGVKLILSEYQKPPIPDDENYAAAPVFQDLFRGDGAANGSNQFDVLHLLWGRPNRYGQHVPPSDLAGWQKLFVKMKWIAPTGNDSATDVLLAMERLEKPLVQIRQASTRPKTHWPINWTAGPDGKMSIPETLQNAGECLELRAKALLALNRPDEALDEVRHIVRAAHSLNGEPLITFGLVRINLWNLALNVAEEGIAADKWDTSHREELSEFFASRNHLADWNQSLSSERCFINYYLDQAVSASPTAFQLDAWILLSSSQTHSPLTAMVCMSPRGWIRRTQVKANRSFDQELADIDVQNALVHRRFSRAESTRENASQLSRFSTSENLSFHLSLCADGSYKAFRFFTRVQSFAMLVALARYREDHGALPNSLTQLVPAYLRAVPHDIMDGQPMRYRRLPDGGCRVWSIGKDRSDSGGVTRKEDRSTDDWVVELPPLRENS